MTIEARDDRHEPFVWVNLEFCTLNIDPATKAVYLEVVRKARRADNSGGCWESVENIAHWANVSVAVAKRSLKKLVEMNILTRESRPGFSSYYRLVDRSKWQAPSLAEPQDRRKKGRPSLQEKPSSNLTQVKDEPAQEKPSSNLTQAKNVIENAKPGSNLTQGGGSNLAHELDPIELDPIKKELDPSIPPTPHENPIDAIVTESHEREEEPIASTEDGDTRTEVVQGELIEFPSVNKPLYGNRIGSSGRSSSAILSSDKNSIPSQQKKMTKRDFAEWWGHVAWKRNKQDAEKAFLGVRDVPLELLIRSLEEQQEWHLRNKGSLQYLKNPAAWLRAGSWEDEMEPVTSRGYKPESVVAASRVGDTAERLRRKFGNH